MPKSLVERLGITDSSRSDQGWSEAYGINPGLTAADLVRETRNPGHEPVDPRARELELRRVKMGSRIEDALCQYVECKFFPD